MNEKSRNLPSDEQKSDREFSIQKIYVKDMSFEAPNTPDIFREEWKPEVNLQLSNNAKTIGDDVQEIVLTITVTAKIGEKTAYLAEVHQAGIFNVKGYNQQDLGVMAGSYCPNILFPYAREAISDIVTKGGFPQLILSPVNFDALYQQHIQQQTDSTDQQSPTKH